jgi:precorrin-2 dehydrogenase/sirohydrochlorin ferrochelatase
MDRREEDHVRLTRGMKVLLIDIDLRGKTVLIIGGGRVGERKAAKFSAAGANVVVASRDFTERFKKLSSDNKLQRVFVDLEVAPEQVGTLISKADFVVAATDQPGLNRRIAEEAKKYRTHVSVVDDPHLGDFSMPVLSKVGEFHIAIFTGGKSPAMSRVIRRRIEGIISEEDILMVRLQSYARKLAKTQIPNQLSRKRVLRTIMEDRRIRQLLKKGDFQEAKDLTKGIIQGS